MTWMQSWLAYARFTDMKGLSTSAMHFVITAYGSVSERPIWWLVRKVWFLCSVVPRDPSLMVAFCDYGIDS